MEFFSFFKKYLSKERRRGLFGIIKSRTSVPKVISVINCYHNE